ncbi:MAG TPA: hypothetical protein VMH88_13490 [Gemmatimonadales bacterium]|nr:hypothetical protein [Gemmatimonadales bacterium]
MALAFVLWTLVIIAVLLAMGAQLAIQEGRAVRRERSGERAQSRAEAGIAAILTAWTPAKLSRQLPSPFDSLVLPPGIGWLGRIHRLNEGLFLLDVSGTDSLAQARLGRLVRSHPLRVSPAAALATRGPVSLGAGSVVIGFGGGASLGDSCSVGDSGVAGVASGGPVTLTDDARVAGATPIVTRSAAQDSVAAMTDGLVFEELARQATVSVGGGSWAPAPALTGGRCDSAPSTNWGDPLTETGACSAYVPIIHITGDALLLGGDGQGILLVDGDLDVSGSFHFGGLVLVRGKLLPHPAGGQLQVTGGLVAGGVGPIGGSVTGLTVIYSKCFIQKALRTSGTLSPLPSRSWKRLF